ncbi:unnamed protein product [Adineta steineri]|uniref:Uncharacterized protein n=1 Tax=Adineta steineri TaxID=433720 RepID=A0A820CA73_9BILA|nr:unnamed protein product [Adineta steineri]CAF4212746.1 unnamed protein product [Adineta steineri]
MKLLSIIIVAFYVVMLIQHGFAGPVAGGVCCTGCCAAILGPAAIGCIPLCVATFGGMPPCTFCAAMFLAPTP